MLVVSTYVEKSDIDGLGLFAGQDIEKGDIVWFLDPTTDSIFSEKQFEDLVFGLPDPESTNFKKWSYKRDSDYVLCADNTKFANHSDTPNLGGEHRQYDIALKDIKIGEELTYDYRVFDREATFKLTKGNPYDKEAKETGHEVGETQS